MTNANRLLFFHGLAFSALLFGCGDSGDKGGGADSGICGTHDNPGVLRLSKLSPALGTSVVNQSIAHGFTVLGAPADYHSFELVYGDGHTAGLSTPAEPRFKTTVSGSDIDYKLVIDSWGHAPGHVVLNAKGSFDTPQGCTWVFPSPLFAYDIIPGPAPDGGLVPDALPPIDSRPAEGGADAALDASALDVLSGGASDLSASVDLPALDLSSEAGLPLDAAGIDAAGTYDLSIELDLPASPIDSGLAVDGL